MCIFLLMTSQTKEYKQMNCDCLDKEGPYVLPSHKCSALHDFEVYELLVFGWISQFSSDQPLCSWALYYCWYYTISCFAYCIFPQNDHWKFLMSTQCLLSTQKMFITFVAELIFMVKAPR